MMLLIIVPCPHIDNPSHNGAVFVKDRTLERSSSLLSWMIGRRTSLIGPSHAPAKLRGTFGSEKTLHKEEEK